MKITNNFAFFKFQLKITMFKESKLTFSLQNDRRPEKK